MSAQIIEGIKSFHIGEAHTYGNITYFPLRCEWAAHDFLSVREAAARGYIRLHDTGFMKYIKVSREDKLKSPPVVAMSGEATRGGLQDRMIARDVFMDEKTHSVRIPVNCIERGRWYDEGEVCDAGFLVLPCLRKINLLSAFFNMSAQETIWQEITSRLRAARTSSATERLYSFYERKKPGIRKYLDFFNTVRTDENGFAVMISGRDTCIEVFSCTALFEKFCARLYASYAAEAVTEMEQKEKSFRKKDIEDFLEAVAGSAAARKIPAGGNCKAEIFACEEAIGSAAASPGGPYRMEIFSLGNSDLMRKKYFERVSFASKKVPAARPGVPTEVEQRAPGEGRDGESD